MTGMGSHQATRSASVTWLTPPGILVELGPFDMDPCAAPEPRPWPTARHHISEDEDGLSAPWSGRVWLNPPYGAEVGQWLERLADHGCGTALVFARTETEAFFAGVWRRATALRFIEGRLHFHRPCGARASANAGAPSVLIAYGVDDAARLRHCAIPGAYVTGWTA